MNWSDIAHSCQLNCVTRTDFPIFRHHSTSLKKRLMSNSTLTCRCGTQRNGPVCILLIKLVSSKCFKIKIKLLLLIFIEFWCCFLHRFIFFGFYSENMQRNLQKKIQIKYRVYILFICRRKN